MALRYVKVLPSMAIYPAIALEAIRQNSFALLYVSQQTPPYLEIALEAIKKNGIALQYVRYQTSRVGFNNELNSYLELCLAAVKQNGAALQHAKEQTAEICMEAVKQDGYALKFVKEQTLEICLEAVKQHGYALQYVNKHTGQHYTTIALEAVKQLGLALFHVKCHLLSPMSQASTSQDTIKEIYLNIALEAIKNNGFAIQYVQYNKSDLISDPQTNSKIDSTIYPNITLENYTTLALEAVKQNPQAIKYIEQQYQTLDMVKECMKNNICVGSNINLSFISKVDTKFIDGSVNTLSISKHKQPKNTIKITTYGETTMIETVKTPLSLIEYVKSKHENIIVDWFVDKMQSIGTLYTLNTVYMLQNDNKYEVYKVEKVSVVKKGWIYNSEDTENKAIKLATYELVNQPNNK